MTKEEIKAIAADIAAQLNEEDKQAISQIKRLVKKVGEEKTRAILAQTLEKEAQGGMLTLDGSRRRTVGGVFFYLARGEITAPEDKRYIWPNVAPKKKAKQPSKEPPQQPTG